MGNLTPRQRAKIVIAEQAEAYIEYQQREQERGGISQSNYDATGSRAEFEDKWT